MVFSCGNTLEVEIKHLASLTALSLNFYYSELIYLLNKPEKLFHSLCEALNKQHCCGGRGKKL